MVPWLNDEQESLLLEYKRSIERREEQRRAEQERLRFSNLFELSRKAMNTELSVCFPLPKLNEDDI